MHDGEPRRHERARDDLARQAVDHDATPCEDVHDPANRMSGERMMNASTHHAAAMAPAHPGSGIAATSAAVPRRRSTTKAASRREGSNVKATSASL
jgi:hypothetical protein